MDRDQFDVAHTMGCLYGDGFLNFKGAFDLDWIQRLREDVEKAAEEAKSRPGGIVERGPNRFYVEIRPEDLRGFTDLVTHPWVIAVSEAVLGPDFKIVELGFDVNNPNSVDQPWHRDFPSPQATLTGRRLNSLAFNITCVDVEEDMGPFEIAPGTQWDVPTDWKDEMFPPPEQFSRYESRAQRKFARMGDISARSALTVHRGTANRSNKSRPVLVLGVDAPDATNSERHDIQFTQPFFDNLPESIKNHFSHRIVEKLEPITQAHQIDGLVENKYI